VAGRGEVALRFDEGFISRQHACFTVDGEEVTITDLGSSNGTFVGDERLAPQAAVTLALGGAVRLGQLELTLERNPAAVATSGAGGDSTSLLETPTDSAATAQSENQDNASDEATGAAPSPWALRGSDQVINLPLGRPSLGRKADQNELVLPDGYISGRHCRFEVSEGELSVTDLGSTNGSFVNGERLERDVERSLKPQDQLRLGQTELTVEFSGEQTIEPLPASTAATLDLTAAPEPAGA
jgi:pSer/pThr/pTyr-binding forkhead associated (FHA) protein